MTRTPTFPRPSYEPLVLYDPGRRPVPVDLSDNTNLWGTHPAALEAIRGAAEEALSRYPSVYADGLRAAAAARFGLGPGNVCTGAGSDDVLDAAFRAAAEAGGEVRFADPTFTMIGPLARMNGRTPVPLDWADVLQDPRRLLTKQVVLVYVCRPNNPTGEVLPIEWVDELLGLVDESGPIVLVDEAYADFLAADDTLAPRAAQHPRLLVVRTMSKAYGLAGMRVGYGLGSPEVVREVEKARGPFKLGRLAEAAAVAALEDRAGWVQRTLDESIASRERLRAELERRRLRALPSATNFLYVPTPAGCSLQISNALRDLGVSVRPFPALGGIEEGLRVTVGPWPMMEHFLAALDEVLEARREDPAMRAFLESAEAAGAPAVSGMGIPPAAGAGAGAPPA